MVFTHAFYFFNILSLCAGAITITLAYIFQSRRKIFWFKFYLAFLISFTSLLFVHMLRLFYNIVPVPYESTLTLIFNTIFIIDLAFMVYFIPFFTTWIIQVPWRKPFSIIFLLLTILFLALGTLYIIFGYPITFYSLLAAIFAGDIIFCLSVIMKNRDKIAEGDVKRSCMTFVILSAAFCPVIAFDTFISNFRGGWVSQIPAGIITLPLYYLWFNILSQVYFINYFRHLPEKGSTSISPHKMERYKITSREEEIINLLQEGLTYKEIAAELNISAHTVNNHVANIYTKTGVKSRIDLIRALV